MMKMMTATGTAETALGVIAEVMKAQMLHKENCGDEVEQGGLAVSLCEK